MVAYLFAGQGSQYVGMGKELYDSFPSAKEFFEKADNTLGFSLSKLCFEGPLEELTRTNNSQPAILTVSIAALKAYQSAAPCAAALLSCTAGLSLGEYAALVAGESLSFEDAVYLVRRRGEFMEEEALKKPGKMACVIGLDLVQIKEVCSEVKAEIANLNCPGQVVISGGVKEIGLAEKMALDKGAKRVVLLEVSGAFHSSFMEGAALKLAKELEKIEINPPVVPIVSNVTAKAVNNPDEIRDNLIKQLISSVLWEDSMRFILSKNISSFIEFGPGRVLKGLMRRIDDKASVTSIENKKDIDSVTANA